MRRCKRYYKSLFFPAQAEKTILFIFVNYAPILCILHYVNRVNELYRVLRANPAKHTMLVCAPCSTLNIDLAAVFAILSIFRPFSFRSGEITPHKSRLACTPQRRSTNLLSFHIMSPFEIYRASPLPPSFLLPFRQETRCGTPKQTPAHHRSSVSSAGQCTIIYRQIYHQQDQQKHRTCRSPRQQSPASPSSAVDHPSDKATRSTRSHHHLKFRGLRNRSGRNRTCPCKQQHSSYRKSDPTGQ